MTLSIISIIIIAILLQFASLFFISFKYYIELRNVVTSKSEKTCKIVSRSLIGIYFMLVVTVLGFVYSYIGNLQHIFGTSDPRIYNIIYSPKELLNNSITFLLIPVFILGNELLKIFNKYKKEKKEQTIKKYKYAIDILMAILLCYWSYVLPVGISMYWLLRYIFNPIQKLSTKTTDVVNKIVQKQIFKNPEKYKTYLLNRQARENEEALIKKYEKDTIIFEEAHSKFYETALREIKDGKKKTHWMWFIFPQLKELGQSENSKKYGIECVEHAKEYMNNGILRAHIFEISNALLDLNTDNISDIFLDEIDCIKLKSSMTLFNYAEPECPIFELVLAKYFNSEKDQLTLDILKKQKTV